MSKFESTCDTGKMYESKDVMVSHPQHYQSEKGLEVIDVIEAFTSDLKGIEATDTGNIIKYACRWYKKNKIQDLYKILAYLNQKEGMAVVMVTHDLKAALRSARTVLHIGRRSTFLGSVSDFLTSPQGKRFQEVDA